MVVLCDPQLAPAAFKRRDRLRAIRETAFLRRHKGLTRSIRLAVSEPLRLSAQTLPRSWQAAKPSTDRIAFSRCRRACAALALLCGTAAIAQSTPWRDMAALNLFLFGSTHDKLAAACSARFSETGEPLSAARARWLDAHRDNSARGQKFLQELPAERTAGLVERFAKLADLERDYEGKPRTGEQMLAWCTQSVVMIGDMANLTLEELAKRDAENMLRDMEHRQGQTCARLAAGIRSVAQRFLDHFDRFAGPPWSSPPDFTITFEAEGHASAAARCMHAQTTLAEAGVTVVGDFGRMRDTAQAIKEAFLPALSGQGGSALETAKQLSTAYLANMQVEAR